MSIPRGIRNNNPGNIRIRDNWQGLVSNPTDKDFCQFVSPMYGIRAITIIIKHYMDRGLETISKIISEWAPSIENDTDSYINSVSQYMNIDKDTCLNFKSINMWKKLIKAIIMHENGEQPYTDTEITKGIQMGLPEWF